jgi:hypothetical protein
MRSGREVIRRSLRRNRWQGEVVVIFCVLRIRGYSWCYVEELSEWDRQFRRHH